MFLKRMIGMIVKIQPLHLLQKKEFLSEVSREGERVKAPDRRLRTAASEPGRDERSAPSALKDGRDAAKSGKLGWYREVKKTSPLCT